MKLFPCDVSFSHPISFFGNDNETVLSCIPSVKGTMVEELFSISRQVERSARRPLQLWYLFSGDFSSNLAMIEDIAVGIVEWI